MVHKELILGKKQKRGIQPKTHSPNRETQWWVYYTIGMLQHVWKWDSWEAGRNHGERIYVDLVSRKTGPESLLCLPTQQ